MDSVIHRDRKAILFHLEEKLESDLARSLAAANCEVCRATGTKCTTSGDLVFCSTGPLFHAAKALFPGLPVIVVSRLPEDREWLDALEAGAADYCAPPFEVIQLRWLIDTHTGATRGKPGRGTRHSAASAAA